MKKTSLLVLLVVAGAVAGGGWWWWGQRAQGDAVQYRTAKLERGGLQATVSASGAVNPVTQVSVGTQVSGQIRDLLVDFNTEVKAGQLIARIDPETFEYRVRSSQADLDAAHAAVLTAQATAAASKAQVSRAQVDLDEARRDLDRKQSLVEKQFIAQSEADRARALVNTSSETLKATQAQVGVTEAQIKTATANVAQREAALAQSRIDLSRTSITSPVDGIVIKRAIEKGQTVAASLQSPELFVIAQNLSDMQVDASVDESDVGRIRVGQRATFTVDAFPGQTFEGAVRQVRKAAQTIANVVTYVAVVGFSNTSGRLLPGMTANVRVVTDARDSVLKVPNAALRVRIAGVEPPAAAGSAPAAASSATTTGDAGGWSWIPEAQAQPAGGQGGGGGAGQAAQRERLVTGLQLEADQQARLDAISAEMRPRFMALRDLPQDDRAAARGKLMAEMQQKINAMLTPDQRAAYELMQAQAANARGNAAAANPRSAASAASAPVATARGPVPAPGAGQGGAGGGTGGTGGGGGPLGEFRNRLVTELQLGADQSAKVDALFAAVRPRFGALRDLAAEDRPKARERIMADLRAQVSDLLRPDQKLKYAALLAEDGGRASTRGRIYLMGEDGKPRAFNVRLGITDGTSTELLAGPGAQQLPQELKEGAAVIVGIQAGAASASGRPGNGPRLPF